MGDSIEYSDILQEIRGAMHPGRLKLQKNSVVFRNVKTGILETLQAPEIEQLTWLVRARGYCLKVVMEAGTVHRFDGFKESDFEKLSSFMSKNYDRDLKKKDTAIKGWNWGTAKFVGNSLDFDMDKSILFDVPLTNVSHTVAAKNEVTLEFHQDDDAAVSLMELRFHIPSHTDPEVDSVNEFHEKVLSKADIIQATGDAIANFSEVQCLTPRGRYDIKIYQTFMQLHGKTFDYKIPYTTILRLFLLPHKDNRQMFFVVSLDPPIKQGQTRYHFLIVLFNKEYETTLELAISEKELEEKYEGKLTQTMSGPEYEIISRVMKTLVNRKITVPGTFIGHSGTHAIGCSYKAATGFLYPLERGFIFVHKPPLHIRFDEVSNVNFARSSGSTRSFDFEVDTKAGAAYPFVSIEKDEYGKLFEFVKNKKLRVKNIGDKNVKGVSYDEMMGSDDEGQHDAYLERMKKEGKDRDDDDVDEDEDSSEDEDFNPNWAVSEPDDEFDSEPESTDESGSGSGSGGGEDKPKKEKKKKEKKEKKERKERSTSDGTRRKKRTKKDPNAPKRPMSGYFHWLNEHREQIKEENPGISITEISKKAGEMWAKITDRTEWEQKHAEEKKKYEKAMEEYRQNLKDNPPSPGSGSSPKSRKPANKKPKTAAQAAAAAASPVKGGSGTNFKSKEFIEDSDSSAKESDSDDSDKPLKKSPNKPKEEANQGSSSSDDDKPLKKSPPPKARKSKKKGSGSEEDKPLKKKSKKKEKESSGSGSDSDKPTKKKTRGTRGKEDSDLEEGLPSDKSEDISEGELTDGAVVSASGSGSGDDAGAAATAAASGSGSGSGSGNDSE